MEICSFSKEISQIDIFLKSLKCKMKSLHYRLCINQMAAAVFIRLPVCDSEWTWSVFESTRIICEEFRYAQPFFNTEDFPDTDLEHIDGYPARYVGIDLSSYQYPDQFPPYLNHFARLTEQSNPDNAPIHI